MNVIIDYFSFHMHYYLPAILIKSQNFTTIYDDKFIKHRFTPKNLSQRF